MRGSEGVIFVGCGGEGKKKESSAEVYVRLYGGFVKFNHAQLYLAVWREMKALVETKPFTTLSFGELCAKWHRLARSGASPSSIYPLLRR